MAMSNPKLTFVGVAFAFMLASVVTFAGEEELGGSGSHVEVPQPNHWKYQLFQDPNHPTSVLQQMQAALKDLKSPNASIAKTFLLRSGDLTYGGIIHYQEDQPLPKPSGQFYGCREVNFNKPHNVAALLTDVVDYLNTRLTADQAVESKISAFGGGGNWSMIVFYPDD